MFGKLIDFLVSVLDLFRFWTVIDPFELGIVLRLGRYSRTIKPGFHLLWPLAIEEVLSENVVPTTTNLSEQVLTCRDGVSIVAATMVRWSISDVRKTLLEVEDADEVLEDTCYGQTTKIIASLTWDEVIESVTDLEEKLLSAMRRRSHKWGIKVHEVSFTDLAKAKVLRVVT